MNFIQFIEEQLIQSQEYVASPQEVRISDQQVVSEINTSSDEDQLNQQYFIDKPQFKSTFEEIYTNMKLHTPPETELEKEQQFMIAELQAKLIIQEQEVMISKKLHADQKNKQSKQHQLLEQLTKEKEVMEQVKIGYDKKFSKLDDKRKVCEATQRHIKQLANKTVVDHLESARKRVNQTVKINEHPIEQKKPELKKRQSMVQSRRLSMKTSVKKGVK